MTSPTDLTPADRVAILDLYARYAHYFDEGRVEEWPDLYAADGRYIHAAAPDRIHQGREAFAAMVRRGLGAGIRHLPMCISVEATLSGAHGSAYQIVVTAGDEGLELRTAGTYDDDLVKTTDGWRFEERRFTSWLPPHLDQAQVAPLL